jgi:hypothetical protein
LIPVCHELSQVGGVDFDRPIGDVRTQSQSRKTIEQAIELFVKNRQIQGVSKDVIKLGEKFATAERRERICCAFP